MLRAARAGGQAARWPGDQVKSRASGQVARWPGARDFLLRGDYFWVSVLIFKKKRKKRAHVVNRVVSLFGHFVRKK